MFSHECCFEKLGSLRFVLIYTSFCDLSVCFPYRPEVVAPYGAARPEPFGRQDRTDDAHLR